MQSTMTRETQDLQILQFVIFSVFISMMNFKFTVGFAAFIAFMFQVSKSKISIMPFTTCKFVIVFTKKLFSFFGIESRNFNIHAFSRTMYSMYCTRSYPEIYRTFWTSFFDLISGVPIMKASFRTKAIGLIEVVNVKFLAALLTSFWWMRFSLSKPIAFASAVFLSLIVAPNLCSASHTIHKSIISDNHSISNPQNPGVIMAKGLKGIHL